MKKLFAILQAIALAVSASFAVENAYDYSGGRKVGVQCYTFNRNTLEETVNMLKATPIRTLEAWSGQKTGLGIDKKFGVSLTPEERAKVKGFLKENGFSFAGLSASATTPEEVDALFAFAKEFGIENISAEPVGEMIKLFDNASKKNGINVAIHNHDNENKRNSYYDAYALLRAIDKTSLTAGPDTGNYARAGVDSATALRVLRGKIFSVHLKDVSKFGMYKRGKSVVYGTGEIDVAEILRELDKQGFDGIIYLEAGEQSKNPVEYVQGCLKFLRAHPKKAAETKQRKVAVQTHPFRRSYTLEETLVNLKRLGIENVQCYPRQTVSEAIAFEFSPKMPKEQWSKAKAMIDSTGIKIVGYGPVNVFTQKEAEELFDFLKFFGIPELVTESTGEGLDCLNRLARQTGIKTGVRNNMKDPSTRKYYDAKSLASIMRRHPNCSASPDTAQWARGGLDCVKSLRYLRGKLSSITLSNVSVFDKMTANPIVSYDSGEIDIDSILDELDSQQFDGFVVIEAPAENTMEIIAQNLDYLKTRPVHMQKFESRKVAFQAFTFRKFTVEKMCEMAAGIGVNNIEFYPGQKVFENSDVKFTHKTPREDWKRIRELIDGAKIRAVSYGVVNSKGAEGAEQVASFAKFMGASQILTENVGEDLELLGTAAEKYGIKVGVHHHAKDSKKNSYFKPDVMLEAVKKPDNIYANPDNGHWARSGIDIVQSLRKLEGHILSIHIKDHTRFNDLKSKCQPFGQGDLNLPQILAELDRQGFNGYYVIENEHIADNPVPALEKCADYLNAKPIGKAYFKTPRKIAIQTYSFGTLPFNEALDKINELNIDAMEAYGRQGFGQKFSEGESVKFGYDMPKEYWKRGRKLVDDRNMQIKIIGTISPKTEAEARTLFEFARAMGASFVNTEVVGEEKWEYMNRLADEFNMNITVHNHALKLNAQSRYYMPEVVKALTNKYKRLKVCPDNGHWARAGVDNVQAAKTLKGRIGNIHFKDMTAFGDMNAKTTVYGRGVLNLSDILDELDRQGFDGYFVIEYENSPKDAFESVRDCKNFLRLTPSRN